MSAPLVQLSNGQKCPQIGFGTSLIAKEETEEVICYAISAGYRHFDCAFVYRNEEEVGRAVQKKITDGTVTRDDLYIVTKLWNTFHQREDVVSACQRSLTNLNLTYVDLYLIHWPVAIKNNVNAETEFRSNWKPFENIQPLDVDYLETWYGMEECLRSGLTRAIGVSNFNEMQLDRILANCKIPPVVNQVEVTPLFNQKPLIKFCQDRGIQVTGYSPFGSPKRQQATPGSKRFVAFDDPRLVPIANKYGKTVPQVILRYLVQLGAIPLPRSTHPERICQNLDVFSFELNGPDMAVLDSFNSPEGRVVTIEEWKDFPHYPF